MTPFLTIKFILEKIFEGYTLDTSAISAKMTGYASFTNDVLINTVADAICPGRINPAQLVPDVTVKDFVAFCEKRYAGKFIVDEVRSKVTFVNNNVVSSVPDMDISAYLSAYPKQGAIEFEKIIVKYNTDVVADTNDSKLKTSTIDFDFYTLVDSKINKAFSNVGQTIFQYVDLTLYLLDIGEIINKNSTLIVDGKTVVEKPTTPTEIKIVSFDDFTNSYFKCMSLSPVGYVTAVRRTLPLNLIPQHPDVKSFYSIFSAFKLNSNIPITAEMNIPAPIMEQLKLHTPKLLNGQSILIESIKYALGKRGTQTVTMRTLRNYADRDPL